MEPKEDTIVDIPKDRLKFFGGAGKMLLPGPATVAALIEKVPAHKLITTNLLCQKLTQQSNVQGPAPVTTQKSLFRQLPMTPATKLLIGGSSKRTEDSRLGFPAAQKVRRNA